MVRDGIRQKGRWPGERKSLRAYLRDELSARSENSPSDSMISAMLNRTAPQVLQDERARGTDLVQLTDRLADLWALQDYVAKHLAQPDRK